LIDFDIGDMLSAPARQASSLAETEHRPWSLPSSSWVMGQTWDDLLFAHWRVDADVVRPHVPDGLSIDERDGSAWVGVTPFVVTGLRARGLFPLPYVSSFRELNVRTYVTFEDKPGIWFFSLDASSEVAVRAARRLYRLPYFRAHITLERRGGRLLYECARNEGKAFSGSYHGLGAPQSAAAASLEHFLTERYCFYAEHEGRLFRADIHHRPWPLARAEASIDLNTMPPDGITLEGEPVLHYSRRQDVVIWPLEEVARRD
jgi:uncharacterized protein YqjF (DUF2071 family)